MLPAVALDLPPAVALAAGPRGRLACVEMETGTSLAAAARVGGLADQAELSRSVRRMFGVTPAHG